MLWGKACPAFARSLVRSYAARRRASAPSQYSAYRAHEGRAFGGEQIGGQKGGIEVSLHRAYATGALMPALREWFFRPLATTMTKL